MKSWNNELVRQLFYQVEKCKNENMPMSKAFELFAKQNNRKPNSVRNYYYFELENLKNNENRCKELQIEIEKHKKNSFVLFDKVQENEMLTNIENLKKQGLSVRSACLKLADGDLTLMTRMQNKYQNLKKKTNQNNIIKFEQRQKGLTEQDINSLFLGLVKLIRKNALEDYVEKQRQEKESSSFLLKKAFLDLNRKDKQIAQLREEFEQLKQENEALKTFKQELFKSKMTKNKLKRIEKENV